MGSIIYICIHTVILYALHHITFHTGIPVGICYPQCGASGDAYFRLAPPLLNRFEKQIFLRKDGRAFGRWIFSSVGGSSRSIVNGDLTIKNSSLFLGLVGYAHDCSAYCLLHPHDTPTFFSIISSLFRWVYSDNSIGLNRRWTK
jgi:hypothetical protein